MNLKYSLFILFFIWSACGQDKLHIADSKFNFLKQSKSIVEGVWLEKNFKQEIKEKGLISDALRKTLNPLALKIDYRNFKSDSLNVSILTTKGRTMHFPFVLRKSGKTYYFEFPNLGYQTKNFIQFDISSKDTILQIKQYNQQNQLIKRIVYKKIVANINDKINQSFERFLNTNLFTGTYNYGNQIQNLTYQCRMDKNSQISGLGGFNHFYFLLSPKGKNKIRLKIANKSIIYTFEKRNNLIILNKINTDSYGSQNYYFNYLYSILGRSNYFVSDIAKLNIIDSSQFVKINFKIHVPFSFPQSIDSLYKTIINSGFFNYKIFYKDKLIKTDKLFSFYNLGKLYTKSGYLYFSELGHKRPSTNYSTELRIPKYCFSKLPTGSIMLDLYIYQRPFSQAFDEQKRSNLPHVYIAKHQKWIWAKIRFKINKPKTFAYKLILNKIKINKQANMDATFIKNGSLADIFWAIFYPQNNQIYWVSKIQKRTNIYNYKDTLTLYTYSPKAKVLIKVMDKDFGSKSELIGQKIISLSELKNNFSRFSFGKIDNFMIKKK